MDFYQTWQVEFKKKNNRFDFVRQGFKQFLKRFFNIKNEQVLFPFSVSILENGYQKIRWTQFIAL